jgi:uncharacterized protein
MRSKLLNADPPITYAVVLDTGDEVIGELGKFVREQEVEAASVTAIGAFSRAVLGYFQWETKQYKKIPVGEQVEVLSLLGDVAVGDPGPTLHLHCGPRGTPIVEARQCFVLAHGAASEAACTASKSWR